MTMRRDAGLAAARAIAFLRDHVAGSNAPSVATVGCIAFEPNAINVIPSRATFTVDMRDPDERRLRAMEAALDGFLDRLAAAEGVSIAVERLARFEPVAFDPRIVELVEDAARRRGLASKRMTSGAGHDAQMLARHLPRGDDFRSQRRRRQPQPRRIHPGLRSRRRRQRASRRRQAPGGLTAARRAAIN